MNAAAPAKAVPVTLEPRWTLDEALRQLVRACLEQFNANAPGAATARNIEFLHQARVALRRMRSALRLAGPSDEAAGFLRAELKWLSGTLGAARDWDVLLADTLPPVGRAYAPSATADPEAAHEMARLLNAARRQRTRARQGVREALGSARHAALVAATEHWAAEGPAAPNVAFALPDYAAGQVRKLHKRLLREAAALGGGGTPAERHRTRICAKRLRYAVEFFGSLYAAKPVRRYLRELVVLQDSLGALNDAATAARLLAGLQATGGAAPFIRGWLAAREEDSVSAARLALRRLDRSPRFWKSSPRNGRPS
jgi:CHAD domain-containing protein